MFRKTIHFGVKDPTFENRNQFSKSNKYFKNKIHNREWNAEQKEKSNTIKETKIQRSCWIRKLHWIFLILHERQESGRIINLRINIFCND